MKEEEIDALLDAKGESEYLKMKLLAYPICNAWMI